MTTVKQLLDTKGHDICAIHPEATVLDALKAFVNNNVGSLMVMEDDKLVGLVTERMYARNVFLKGKHSPTTLVRDIMETEVVYADPENTVPECMAIMTDKKIRHLPVMENGKVLGLISIGDLVQSTISDQKFTIEQLEHYIRG